MASTMKPDAAGPGAGSASAQRKSPPSGIRQALGGLASVIVELWWRFFDWLALVPWKTLLVLYLLGMIVAGILNHPEHFFIFVVLSAIIKIVAGGKRRADLTARRAEQRAQSEQLERAVLEARMEALQAQIEPHFLFNTLASIDQLITTDPPRASKMQRSLIRYLRSAMPQLREGVRPTLGQQVELSRAYLEIMAVRMEERLAAVIDVPDGLKSAAFPSMMLQTLVENSIRHGLEPKAAGGTIEIRAEVADGGLAVRVQDSGVGFDPKSGEGVGLANIRERLRALYGGRAELAISVPPGGGTCATIRIPYEIAGATP